MAGTYQVVTNGGRQQNTLCMYVAGRYPSTHMYGSQPPLKLVPDPYLSKCVYSSNYRSGRINCMGGLIMLRQPVSY